MNGIRFNFFVAALLLALAQGNDLAAQCNANAEAQLVEYLRTKCNCRDHRVLAFNHSDPDYPWLAAVWDGNTLDKGALKNDLRLDVNKKPRLSVGGDDRLVVVVYNTNPMLYAVDPGKTEEADPEALAQFKQLAGLLGGVTSEALRISQQFSPVERNALMGEAQADAMNLDLDPSGRLAAPTFDKVKSNPLGDLLIEITNLIEKRTEGLPRFLADAQTHQAEIRRLAFVLERNTTILRSYMRNIESGRTVNQLVGSLNDLPGLDVQIDTAARNLANIEPPILGCRRSYASARSAVNRKIRILNGQQEDPTALQNDLNTLAVGLTGADRCSAEEQSALADLRSWLESHDQATTEERKYLDGLFNVLNGFLELASRLDQISASTADLLSKVPAAAKSAEALATLISRESKYILNGQACSLTAGVIPVFPAGDPEVKALKLQKRKFSIKAAAPLSADIEKRRKDLDAVDYELDSAFLNDVSFGFGVLYTDLASPSWTAATKTVANNQETVIVRSDEETRAGEAALILSFVPQQKERFLRWGFDIGAALSTDKPMALAGFSLSLGRFVRLGFGALGGWIKELDGQREFRLLDDGTVDPASRIGSKDEIRTRDDFKGDLYISLSFTLDALPFFRPAS